MTIEILNDEANNMVEFSDEEGYGKFLDLYEVYDKFVNLKGVERVDYISYIQSFDQLYDVPKERKGADYKHYLGMLLDYLYGFLRRVKPLLSLEQELADITKEFEEKFKKGEFPGWPRETGGALTHTGAHLDLSAFSCPEELASLGLDRYEIRQFFDHFSLFCLNFRLKSALMALGLKCGGTLEERAVRLFSTKGKRLNDLNPALFAKTKPGKGGKKDTEKLKEVASMESQVYRFAELLGEFR